MDELDLTNEPQKPNADRNLVEKPYIPGKAREQARSMIAYMILLVVSLIVAAAFYAYIIGKPLADIKDLLGTVFTPILGLFGAVIGFYFGVENSKS